MKDIELDTVISIVLDAVNDLPTYQQDKLDPKVDNCINMLKFHARSHRILWHDVDYEIKRFLSETQIYQPLQSKLHPKRLADKSAMNDVN